VNSILLDTNAYAAFRRGNPDAVMILQRASLVVVNSIILGELLGGFDAGTKAQANRGDLTAFLSSPRVAVLPIDHATSEFYAAVYVALRKAGTPIPTNDIWIAASALQHGLRLFTYDKHFQQVPGLATGATLSDLTRP
jgi:tRNA(fMet)-specific endonuclease VapC